MLIGNQDQNDTQMSIELLDKVGFDKTNQLFFIAVRKDSKQITEDEVERYLNLTAIQTDTDWTKPTGERLKYKSQKMTRCRRDHF